VAQHAQLGFLASTILVTASLILPAACSESDDGGAPGGTGGAGDTGGTDGAGDAGEANAGGDGAVPADDGGAGGAATTNGGAAPAAGSGGTGNAVAVIPWGGAASHECPDTLLNRGSGPGILCEVGEGVTCADADHRCECGAMTFEGAPWRCVPSRPDCPETIPEDGATCTQLEPCDFVRDGARWRCDCTDDGWSCSDVDASCSLFGPDTGEDCAGLEGTSCDYLRPAYSGIDTPPANVPCACSAEGAWGCAEG